MVNSERRFGKSNDNFAFTNLRILAVNNKTKQNGVLVYI